jgi:hypothetical protein
MQVEFQTVMKTAYSGLNSAGNYVIRSKEELGKLIEGSHADIDFGKEMVIAVALGQKRTGGYGIEVREINEVDGKLEVIVESTSPKPSGMVSQALTQPIHVVRTARYGGEVVFK